MSWFNDVIRDSAINNAGGGGAERALAEQQIRAAYQQYLGRTAGDDEIAGQLANGIRPEQVQNAVDGIRASPERNAYLSAHQNEDGSYGTPAAPPPPPAATSGGGGGGGGSASEFGQAWLASGGADLNGFLAQWNSTHPNLQASFSGKKNHDVTIGGQTYHALNSDGAKFWMTGGGGGGSTSAAPGLSYAPFQAPAPFTEQFSYPTWDKQFTAPTADQVYQDPVVQAQMKLGQRGIQTSAAARGTLLTTGTLKDLDQFGQTVGATYGGDVYNRALGQYEQERQNYLQNYGKALGEYQQRYGIYGDTFNRDLAANAQQFGQGLQTGYYGLANQNQGFTQNMALSQLGLQTQGQQFNQGYSLANLGLNAANSANNNLFGYAGLYGNTLNQGASNYLSALYGGANATAAGQVGSGNAYNSALSNIGNNAASLAYLYGSGYGKQGANA